MGDGNTKWFHKKATMRKTCNSIHGIERANGSRTEDLWAIENIFIDHFRSMFSSSSPLLADIEAIIDLTPISITPEVNARLLTPYGKEEIEIAVK